MLWLLQLIFLGHVHEDETIDKHKILRPDGKGGYNDVGSIYHVRCKKCGRIDQVKFYVNNE